MEKKVYIIWIGWIWISAIARYYNESGYSVYWSDSTDSELIWKLRNEWIEIIIWEDESRLNKSFELVVFTEAIPKTQSEYKEAIKLWIKTMSYPIALASIANSSKLISIAGTHGKSTTTSLTSLVFKNSELEFSSVVWTILKEFDWKNFYKTKDYQQSNDNFFVIEACEYKRSFISYKPSVWIITNIELDHLDYYKDLDDYMSAYQEYLENIVPWGFAILNWEDLNCKKLLNLRNDIRYIEIYNDHYSYNWELHNYPEFELQIPWEHILFDAKIAYVIGHMLWIHDINILDALESYNGVWRRMEVIWETTHWNILMSDYWHHPTEIELTLKSLKEKYADKKIVTIFQPHQYNRTIELIEWFKTCFSNTDKLIIPDIYESRDSENDKAQINSEKLVAQIKHQDVLDWKWLENSLSIINDFDKWNPNSSVLLLLWAGNVDDLRFDIKLK